MLIRKGIPAKFRTKLWLILSGADGVKNASGENYFNDLLKASTTDINEELLQKVQASIADAIPHQKYFDSSSPFAGSKEAIALHDSTFRIVMAYMHRKKLVEFCNSMSTIAAWLMLVLGDEEAAFYVFTSLVESKSKYYYTETQLGVQADVRVIYEYLLVYCPEFVSRLESFDLSISALVSDWLLRGFVGILPSDACVRVWDNYIVHGSLVFVEVAVALIKAQERTLLGIQSKDILTSYFQYIPRTVYDHKALFRVMRGLTSIDEKSYKFLKSRGYKEIKNGMTLELKNKFLNQCSETTKYTKFELNALYDVFFNLCRETKAESAQQIKVVRGKDVQETLTLDFTSFQLIISLILPGWQVFSEQARKLCEIVDAENAGVVTFPDFAAALSKLSKGSLKDRLELCYRSFVQDGADGLTGDNLESIINGIFKVAPEDLLKSHILREAEREKVRTLLSPGQRTKNDVSEKSTGELGKSTTEGNDKDEMRKSSSSNGKNSAVDEGTPSGENNSPDGSEEDKMMADNAIQSSKEHVEITIHQVDVSNLCSKPAREIVNSLMSKFKLELINQDVYYITPTNPTAITIII